MTVHLAVPGPVGDWLAVVRPSAALLVRPGTIPAAELHAALGGEDPVRDVIERLTSSGLNATPDFALVARSSTGPLHVVVRGPVGVELADGVIDGAEVSTWTERVVSSSASYTIRVPDGHADIDADALPLQDGAVWATGILLADADAVAESAAQGTPRRSEQDAALPIDDPGPAAVVDGSGAVDASGTDDAWGADDASGESSASGDASAEVDRAQVDDEARTDDGARAHDESGSDDEGEADVDPTEADAERAADVAAPVGSTHDPSLAEDTVVVPPVGAAELLERLPEDTVLPLEEPDSPEADHPADGEEHPADPDAPLDEATIVRPGDGSDPVGEATSSGPDSGDHDGMTVMSGDVAGMSERSRPSEDEIAGPGETLAYAVVLPDGSREPLDGEMLIGRSPSGRVTEGRTPRLVTLSGDPDISRTHVRIALEGDTVVVTDMHSRNGTTLQLAGKSPQLLRAGEPAAVIPGTVVDLGGGTLLRIEATG